MKTLLILAALALTACTSTAGPFITNISSAGPGRIRVEKCTVEFSSLGYYRIETGECSNEVVAIER